MSSYTIQESPLGTFALTINNQLIIQSTDRTDCERVMTALEHRGHAERVLKATYYDANSNEIRDGIDVQ